MGDVRRDNGELGDFRLGRPELVCRWRLAAGRLPLENRHVRALSRRRLGGEPPSAVLLGWVRQHVEWTLERGAAAHPDGVLMLIVDEEGHAAMTVGPYEPLARPSLRSLAARALDAAAEGERTGVAPESLWLVRDDHLVFGCPADRHPSGANDLVAQLASTLGMAVVRDRGAAEAARTGRARCDEAFLVSDEHGVVVARDARGPRARRFRDSYERLLEQVRAR